MSKEELKNQIEGITHYFSEGGYCFDYVKPEDVQRLVKIKVQEALEVIKTLVDNNVTVTSEHVENLIRSKAKI